jgi:hypothetical protein
MLNDHWWQLRQTEQHCSLVTKAGWTNSQLRKLRTTSAAWITLPSTLANSISDPIRILSVDCAFLACTFSGIFSLPQIDNPTRNLSLTRQRRGACLLHYGEASLTCAHRQFTLTTALLELASHSSSSVQYNIFLPKTEALYIDAFILYAFEFLPLSLVCSFVLCIF